MFAYICTYVFNDASEYDGLIPFDVLPKPKKLMAVTSSDSQSSKSNYTYEPILKRILTSTYMQYPCYLIVETYSKEVVEKEIVENKLDYLLLLEKPNSVVFKVVIKNENDLLAMLPTLFTSGTDSLFNVLTAFDEIVCINNRQISIDLSKNSASKAISFLYDLQELCFLSYEEWQDKALIKDCFLQGYEIVDDYEVKVLGLF